mmetsp:Transcript_14320/g.18799  ORF Transcript_14320/g.18799 Transcript_14320/m.18799 type:complete len:277 (-) Transcript_14320:179-1009(-)
MVFRGVFKRLVPPVFHFSHGGKRRAFSSLSSLREHVSTHWLFKRELPNNVMHISALCSNAIAVCAFIWTVKTHYVSIDRKLAYQNKFSLLADIKDSQIEVSRTQPRRLINALKLALRTGAGHLESQKEKDDTLQLSLAEYWIYALEHDEEWAVEVDECRSKLKGMWFEVMKMYDLVHADPLSYSDEKIINVVENFLHDSYPLGTHVARNSLVLLEPLDKAAFKANSTNRPRNLASRSPKIYNFIRRNYPDLEISSHSNALQLKHALKRCPSESYTR